VAEVIAACQWPSKGEREREAEGGRGCLLIGDGEPIEIKVKRVRTKIE